MKKILLFAGITLSAFQFSNAQQYLENNTSSNYVGKWDGKTSSVGLFYHGSGNTDYNAMTKYGIYRSHNGANTPSGFAHTTALNIGTSGDGSRYGFQFSVDTNISAPKMAFRTFGDYGDYGDWNKILHDNNFVSFFSSLNSVGVGITNPEAKLEVKDSGTIGGYWNPTNSYFKVTDGTTSIIFDPNEIYSNNTLHFGSTNGSYIAKFRTIGSTPGHESEKMVIQSNGNVGIGTTSSGAKLNVGTKTVNSPSTLVQFGESKPSGEARVLSLINSGGGSNQSTSLDFHNKDNWSPTGKIQLQQIGAGTEANMHFYTYNSGLQKRMTIDEDGNVGIGTTDPKNKLSVNGPIWATEVKIQLTDAADWVFDESYDLRPLNEVADYIKENKHLPEIPSAEEFRENDLKVSEMTNKLLQKIEELTLYTIEQQEQIDIQKKQLKEMDVIKAKLEKLETLLLSK